MAYKFRLGTTEMSGTLGTDDIHFTDDTDTGIDFESDKIKLETNNTSRLEVDNSRVQVLSQLVVGSTSAGDWSLAPPSEDALHVQDGTTVFQKNSADEFPPTVAFNKSRNATDGSNTIVQNNDCLGYIHFKGNDGSGYEEAACIAAYVHGTPGSDDMPGRLVFATTPDGDDEVVDRMAIDSSGRVGIGTMSPSASLHVKGDPGQFRIEDTTVDYTYTVDCDGDGIRTHFGDMTAPGDEDSFMTFGAYTGINRLDTAGRDFHIYGTNTTTGFYFDESAGKFGIGTTSPDEKLEVAGNLQVAGNDPRIKIEADTDSHPGLEFYENGTRKWIIYNNYGDDSLDFKTNSAIRMVIDQTGEVGIGTTSPKSTLSVAGSLALNVTGINSSNDPGTTYSVAATDCVILVNTRSTAQGGIDSAITITLPDASSFPGRVVTIKDAAGNCDVNAITISRAGSDTINGVDATVSLPTPSSFKTLISDGVDSWQEIGS